MHFAGDDVPDILASVLTREPDMTALPPGVPPAIRHLLRRCLEKNPRERLRDMGDARLDIRDALQHGAIEPPVASPSPAARRRERIAWALALLLLAVTVAVAAAWALRPDAPAFEARLEITTPPTPTPASVAISPDGRRIAFAAIDAGQLRLWVRALDAGVARPLPGTEGAHNPFWSPNGQSIGFFAGNRLKRVDPDGGAVQVLANVHRGTGGTWNRDDVILFSSLGDPIARVSAAGGLPEEVSGLFKQGSNFSPHFLPDGRRFLYYVRGTADVSGSYVGQLDGGIPPRRLLDGEGPAYASSGHLLFVRQGRLLAQRFDPDRLELAGAPFSVSDPADNCRCNGLSVSADGTLVYRPVATGNPARLAWFDRVGQEIGTP